MTAPLTAAWLGSQGIPIEGQEYDDGVSDDPPPPSADEQARKQRVVDAIGIFMAKPPTPLIPRRWRRPGFR